MVITPKAKIDEVGDIAKVESVDKIAYATTDEQSQRYLDQPVVKQSVSVGKEDGRGYHYYG